MVQGLRLWSDAAPVAGEQYGYAFDALGNRVQTSVNSRVAKYFANAVNELTQREVPGAFEVLGTASPGATVSVNGQLTVRHDRFFAATVPVENVAQAQEVPVTITAAKSSGTTSQSHRFFVPQTPENFTYDPDGNLTSDGHWSYRWDAEPRPMGKRRDRQKVLTFCPLGCRGREAARHQNRLVGVESLPVVPTLDRVRLVFGYDAQGRRVRKEVWTWDPGQNGWALHHTFLFVYDGWNLLAELSASGRPVRAYTWGQDVSGSPQGAGGIGGLLWEQDLLGGQTGAATYDLQGNLTALLETRTGQPFAQYAYGPFGEPIRTTGEYAELNPFRFSTKYTDLETGLAYYGYRYYQPQTGRWLSRDPIGEEGGINVYRFVGNQTVNTMDLLGLRDLTESETNYADNLETQASQFMSTNIELAKALRAVKKDYTDLIHGLKGNQSPARVQLLNRALEAWTDAGNVEKYRVNGDEFKCSLLVRRSLGTNAPEWTASDFVDEPNKNMLIVYKIQGKKTAGQIDTTQPEVTIHVRMPKIGDIIAMGVAGKNGTNTGHVGIFLGSGLFLNATIHVGPSKNGWPDTAGFSTETGGVGIKLVPELQNSGHDIIVYRSPDRQ